VNTKGLVQKLAVFNKRIKHGALVLSAAGLVLMTLIIGWQVFARYILNASPAWSESAALLLMLYFIMLTAAVGVSENFHLGLKILLDSVSAEARRRLKILNNFLIMLFGAAMLFNGSQLARFTADHTIPTLEISRASAYWPFAASGLLIIIFALERMMTIITDDPNDQLAKDT
tara:strand:- start:199 stop:717 length:519 start_codon:yes stop_codon:yes gene_type:complete